ncbi:Uncharacterised protein [Mycobacteroides abscessus subsp. abscessus]|nr:Uncharacterised protein [Mycobacteroides abscessus subsp. abscessus]
MRFSAISGVLPQGAGSGNLIRATLSATRTSSSSSSSRSARLTMFCAATAFVALAPSLAACALSADAFFSALARSRRRRCSSVARASRYFFQPML